MPKSHKNPKAAEKEVTVGQEMIELVILASSSSPSTSHSSATLIPPPPPPPNPSFKLKSKPSLRTLPSPSKPVPALRSRFPPPSSSSSSYVRWDLTTSSSLLNHYATLAAALAADCRLHDFAFIAESLVASGVEASRFASALNLQAVAKGIAQSLREGNGMSVVEILRRVEAVGVSTVKLFDGVAMDLLKAECSRILDCSEMEKFVDLMDALAGFSFPVKELVDPSEVIRICIDKRNPKTAVRYVSILPRERILYCTILNEFGKRRDLDSALTAYEEWKKLLGVPNMYVYRTIIDVCGLCGDYRKSRLIFQDLINQEVIPNVYVFNSLMNVNAHDLSYTLNLYKNMQKLGVLADIASYNILLKACCLAGRVDLAQDIYREIREMESRGLLKLDVFTYCTIIKVFADAKLWQMALKVKEDMKLSGITPNRYTWSSMISACANAGLVEQAIQLFEEMLLAGCEPNPQCCNILLHACVEACQYDRAFRLFKSWKGSEDKESSSLDNNGNADSSSSPDPNNRTSVTIVSNCTSHPKHLNFIKKLPFTPTPTTYNILMKACGSDYSRAKALMDEMKSVGLSPSHISWSILMDICGASGNIQNAVQILKNMREAGVEPDVVAYTTAIKICVECKNLKLAFSLFTEMKRYQIKPNLVTYNTLLRARSRYGSLQEVQQCLYIYQDMRKAGYKPNDYYLKQLIEEWCEGVLQDNNHSQDEFTSHEVTDSKRPNSVLLEKVAAHLHNSIADTLMIDLQGLTKVEARIVILAVLRMIKENFAIGHLVKDDMWITLGIGKHQAKLELEVKDAVVGLLQNELGLEVQFLAPRVEVNTEADPDLAERFERNSKRVSSTRRPVAIQRLKIRRKSLGDWLQRREGAKR